MINSLLSHLDNNYVGHVLEEMISINSVVGNEGDLVEYLRFNLEALGLNIKIDEVEPGRPNIYARLEGNGPGKVLHFNGQPIPCQFAKAGKMTHSHHY